MEFVILFPFVLACAVSDLRTTRIPNTLILCGLAGALLTRFFPLAFCSPSALLLLKTIAGSLAGFTLPWLLFGPLAVLKMMGGGDVKLLSVIGLWTGVRGCLMLMWYSLLFAAGWSVLLVIRHRNLSQRLRYLYEYIGRTVVSGRLTPYRTGSGNVPGPKGLCPAAPSSTTSGSRGEFCFALPVLAAFLTLFCFPGR